MAGEIIRPYALPARLSPVATEVVPSDNGSVVGGVTWAAGVAAGRPLASQAEAEAGVEAAKAMTPLTTKQAIQAQGDVRFATSAQGVLADTAVQPSDVGTAAAEDVGFFATAAQGALADSATQPGDLGTMAAENIGAWTPIAQAVPVGGAAGQALVKASSSDNDVEWGDGPAPGDGTITELKLAPELRVLEMDFI